MKRDVAVLNKIGSGLTQRKKKDSAKYKVAVLNKIGSGLTRCSAIMLIIN